jgi:hypothetical protein
MRNLKILISIIIALFIIIAIFAGQKKAPDEKTISKEQRPQPSTIPLDEGDQKPLAPESQNEYGL